MYPLVMTNIAKENGPFIVSFPIEHGHFSIVMYIILPEGNCTDNCGEVIYVARKWSFIAELDPVFLYLYRHLCLNNDGSIAVSVPVLLVA